MHWLPSRRLSLCERPCIAPRSFCRFFFSSRRRHTRCSRDWSSDVCSSDLATAGADGKEPELDSHEKDDSIHLTGKTFTASFTPEGWLTRMEAAGGVKGSRENGNDADDFIADNASMELRPRRNEIKELNLRGDVQLKSKMEKTGESRTLETSALLVQFAERNKIGRAHV